MRRGGSNREGPLNAQKHQAGTGCRPVTDSSEHMQRFRRLEHLPQSLAARTLWLLDRHTHCLDNFTNSS